MGVENVSEEPEKEREAEHQQEALNFPMPLYTVVIIVSLAAVFLVQLYVGLDRSFLTAGFDKPAFFYGEYWRILTGAMLHRSVVHILMNCYAFYSFGKLFEVLTNRAHLALVFLFSAIGGGLLSAYFMPGGRSVGASGGIIGLIGYLLIYAFRRRQFVSSEFRKSLLINIGFIMIFGLVLYGIVDNWGHIGGLITGAVYGLIQIPSNAYKNPQETNAFVEALGLGALGICIAGSIFSIYLMLSF